MRQIDPRVIERISGRTWDAIRSTLMDACDKVLHVSADARADLTTIYAKFSVSSGPGADVYAVVWLKTARNVVFGFALPDGFSNEKLTKAPAGMSYRGLTGYFKLDEGTQLPPDFSEWARLAFDAARAKATHETPES